MSLVKSYEGGRESHGCVVVRSMFEEYLFVEELFSDAIQVQFIITCKSGLVLTLSPTRAKILGIFFQSDVIERLRLQHAKDLEKVVYIVFSHQVMCLIVLYVDLFVMQRPFVLTICVPFKGVKRKNGLLLRLMELLVYPNPSAYRDQLIRFSALNHTTYSGVKLSFNDLH
jgi:acetyl-CoA carboxylase/biotin carboxylase 1